MSTSYWLVATSSITIGARIGVGPSFCTPAPRAVPIGIGDRACHDASVAALVSRSDRLTRPALLGMWLGAFGFGLLSMLIAQSHPGATFGGESWEAGVVELVAGSSMIAAGLYVWWGRGEGRSGFLLAMAGIAWFVLEWDNPGIGIGIAFTVGLAAHALAPASVAHAVLAYPFGGLPSRPERLSVGLAYVDTALILGLLPTLFFDPSRQGCSLCPPNLFVLDSRPDLFESLNVLGIWLGIAWTIGIAALCMWRLVRSSAPVRRLTAPVLLGGIAYLLLVLWGFVHSLPRGLLGTDQLGFRLWIGQAAALSAIGLSVAWSWLLRRRTRSSMASLVVELGESPPLGALREVLARSLGDPDLKVAYPLSGPERLVDATGTPVHPAELERRAVTPLVRKGQTVAMLIHRQGLLDDPAVVDEVVAATRLALENDRLQAEVLAQLEDLRASRARIVATGDAERRRLERDLHDGAQQRLVGLSLALRMARGKLGPHPDPKLTGLMDRTESAIRTAIDELRELAHGIYPAVLADEGLSAAAEALAYRATIPIEIIEMPEERFPIPVETAAYLLIAEVTGAAAELAGARGVTVDVRRDGKRLVIEVADDRAGDVNRDPESGFTDLADRIGALEGKLQVQFAPAGTRTIRAEIPCES
jgi:signal transduction histidine kinase